MDLEKKSVDEFTSLIASKTPFPGGGGASAAVAAIGVALGDMVGELTVGKKSYAENEAEIRELMQKSQDLRKRFLELINEDAEGFEPLSKAYGIPKDDPGREEEMEKCLRLAAAAPLEIFDLSCEAITIFGPLAQKGSKLAISDAATGVVFCWSAMYGAAVNVKVNTRLMKDREYAEKINKHVDDAMEKYWPIAERTYELVYTQF